MDIFDAAAFYDETPVLDAYSGATLFSGQLDQYDAAIKDSLAGWRRTISTAAPVLPTRGAVSIFGEYYLTGRVITDGFKGTTIRKHVLLHPCPGLFSLAPAVTFLTTGSTPATAYASAELRKEEKEEGVSSQLYSLVNIYLAPGETVARDYIAKGTDGIYYRVQNIEPQTGGLKTLVANELGSLVKTTISYGTAGTYDSSTDTTGTTLIAGVGAFVERYQDNYRYTEPSAVKFTAGDKVVTVSATVIISPQAGDTTVLTDSVYNVVGYQSDGLGSWELHVRPQ